MDAVRQLIEAKMREIGETPASLSRQIGRNHAYLQQYLKRGIPQELGERDRERLAPLLGLEPNELRSEGLPAVLPALKVRRPFPPQNAGGSAAVDLRPTVPLLGQGAAGPDGGFPFNGERVADVSAPPALARVRTAYAIYVVGISMLPRYEPGELVFVDPTKPVIKGNYVVVQIAGDAGEHQGYIKRYLGRDDHTLRLDQLNPKKKLAFPMNRVIAVHRIIMGGKA